MASVAHRRPMLWPRSSATLYWFLVVLPRRALLAEVFLILQWSNAHRSSNTHRATCFIISDCDSRAQPLTFTLAPNDSRNDNACHPNMRDWIMDGAEKPTELVARSCHFRPWYLVCHFPVCHFPSLPIIRECNCTQRHVKTYSWLSTAEKQ